MVRAPLILIALSLQMVGCAKVIVNTQVAEVEGDNSIPPPRARATRTPNESLAAGVAYLLQQQSDDGAWRSDVYATFKEGTALTPLAVTALQAALDAGDANPDTPKAIEKGLKYLGQFANASGVRPTREGFDYPVYTAALTLKAFSHQSARDYLAARVPWVKYLKERQLTEKIGWKPKDKEYGGWGYCQVIPKKPEPNTFAPSLIESNVSATMFALDALHRAGELDVETTKAAAVFVRRCQNDDGGFHFIYDDPVRNKAGVVSINAKPLVFHSYGSTTADGFRALTYCGLPNDKNRRKLAAEWLQEHFRADTHPGTYAKGQEANREAVFFYYVASASQALRESGMNRAGGNDWAIELPQELAARQKKDGSWENRVGLVRENDPIVATCNAISALAACRPPKSTP